MKIFCYGTRIFSKKIEVSYPGAEQIFLKEEGVLLNLNPKAEISPKIVREIFVRKRK